MSTQCRECGSPEIDAQDEVGRLRGICGACWAEMPWQERAQVVASNLSQPKEEVHVWDVPYDRLTADFLRLASPFPQNRLDDIVRCARVATQPVMTNEHVELDDPRASGVGVLYRPKGWAGKREFSQSRQEVRYAAPDKMAGAVINIQVTPQEWHPDLPSRPELARRIESHLAEKKYTRKGAGREVLVDGYPATQAEWETYQGVLGRTHRFGITTYCECHDQALVIDGWCEPKQESDFQRIYRLVADSFQFEPLVDAGYSSWLKLTTNSDKYLSAISQTLADPRRVRAVQDSINKSAPDWEMRWKLHLSLRSGLSLLDAKASALAKPYLADDERFWTIIRLFGMVGPSQPHPGPTPPLVRRLPELFERFVESTTTVICILARACSKQEIAKMLLLLRNDPDKLYADSKDSIIVSKSGREASALLKMAFRPDTVGKDLAELASAPEFGVALRMRLYRGAEHNASKGAVKPLRRHAALWRALLGRLDYRGEELERIIACIQTNEYLEE